MYIVVSLALNQTIFFAEIFQSNALYIACDSDSKNLLKSKGYQYVLINRSDSSYTVDSSVISKVQLQVSHELLNFRNRSESQLLELYTNILDILDSLKIQPKAVVQELGGYVINKAIFDWVAKQESVSHYFIEPSFFNGEFFMIKDSYMFDGLVTNNESIGVDEAVVPEFNIPIKDRRHYASPTRKIFSVYTAWAFSRKLYGLLVGKSYYFDDILGHARKHLRELNSARQLKESYCDFPGNISAQSIFLPLHVPGDAALTIREPDLLDQLSFVRRILESNPDKIFYLKEHPARIGSIPASKLKALLSNYANVRLLRPSISVKNICNVISYCAVINSKAGAEFLYNGNGAFVFGKVYYGHFVNARECRDTEVDYFNLSDEYMEDFESLKRRSFKGEIFVRNESNTERFRRVFSRI